MEQNLLDNRAAKGKKRPTLPPAEEEMELEFPAFQSLNKRKSAFDEAGFNRTEGINTAPSVFDRRTVLPRGEDR